MAKNNETKWKCYQKLARYQHIPSTFFAVKVGNRQKLDMSKKACVLGWSASQFAPFNLKT